MERWIKVDYFATVSGAREKRAYREHLYAPLSKEAKDDDSISFVISFFFVFFHTADETSKRYVLYSALKSSFTLALGLKTIKMK